MPPRKRNPNKGIVRILPVKETGRPYNKDKNVNKLYKTY